MNLQITRNGTVFMQLREDIVMGRLRPGERLRTETLRQRYAVGGSPVREALMRLESEGLVELEENKGFRVAAVSQEQLDDLSATRTEIEGIALRKSIALGGVEWEANLVSAMHFLASASRESDHAPYDRNADWLAYHREFHRALVAGCNSPILLDIRERLFDLGERYVALSISTKGEARDHVAEHRAIMAAALERDADTAVRLNREHIERTTEKLKLLGDFAH
ncbi:GntR family transcriptional regulator [Nitratireductor soli]|uniref:GntR family transcriptional regulator n=1 Tax=Nitratireductor soli TaxID=1670619 RepID=UPI00065E4524|nr:FCD domain-containing protein [Nitratireductor soli]